jgi:hypothetical protein
MKSTFLLPLLLLGAGSTAPVAMAQVPGAFTATGKMITPRSMHTATVLPDGRVLIAGGDSAYYFSQTESSTELYDPVSGTFEPARGMTTPRSGHTATLLPNGTVLIAGGGPTIVGTGPLSSASAEIYDPGTGKFTATGDMNADRSQHTATLLKNGKVLIAGGYHLDQFRQISYPAGAELYDPSTRSFAPIRSMPGPYCDSSTLLADGRVLITSRDPDHDRVSHASIYDPSTGSFTATASMQFPRQAHAATLLPDGTVLMTGGTLDNFYNASPFAELYDPSTGAFFGLINMNSNSSFHQATLLQDGRVLITGGIFPGPYSVLYGSQAHNSAELYTPPVLVPAPALLSLSGDGTGQGAIWHAARGQIAYAQNPAVAGEVLAMYTTSLIEGGVIPPQVAVDGRLGEILYFGDAPGYPGYNQVNFRVPDGVAAGSAVSVRLTYIGRASNAVTIGVR